MFCHDPSETDGGGPAKDALVKAFLPKPGKEGGTPTLVTGYSNARVNAVLALDERGSDPTGVFLYYLVVPGSPLWCASDLDHEISALYRDEMDPEDVVSLLLQRVKQLESKVQTLTGTCDSLRHELDQIRSGSSDAAASGLTENARNALLVELKNDMLNDPVFMGQKGQPGAAPLGPGSSDDESSYPPTVDGDGDFVPQLPRRQ